MFKTNGKNVKNLYNLNFGATQKKKFLLVPQLLNSFNKQTKILVGCLKQQEGASQK